ncbi:hypothetical protein COCNU_scaffold004099G000030 [Cocos nucifera]|nr:hypothetical protein [Cocos nucifera]
MVPHVTTLFQMLTAQSAHLEELEGSILRLTGRVLDLQRQVIRLGIPRSNEFVPPISVLSAEGDNLCSALKAKIQSLRDEVRDSSEDVSTAIGILMQTLSRAIGQLDSIRLILLSQTSSSFTAGSSRPHARATSSRVGASTRGRGRRGRGRVPRFDPVTPYRISNSPSNSDASSRDIY